MSGQCANIVNGTKTLTLKLFRPCWHCNRSTGLDCG